MIHERVDIERWEAMFPLDALREKAKERVLAMRADYPSDYPDQESVDKRIATITSEVNRITSPFDLAVVELLRKEALAGHQLDRAGAVPTDVFVFSKGEPPNREVTKVGGLPYWPRRKKWPCRWPLGKPMTFIAQMCMADSTDITGQLPGDILLIFGDVEDNYCLSDKLAFFWMKRGETDLISQDGIPETGVSITPCWGSISRTADYDAQYFSANGINCALAAIEGTKIGGLPKWVQTPIDYPGRFLAAVGSIQPSFEQPFPWLNVPEPIAAFEELYGDNYLMWGDMGTLYLFIDDKGKIHWGLQCY